MQFSLRINHDLFSEGAKQFNWIVRQRQMAPSIFEASQAKCEPLLQHVQNTCWLIENLPKTLALTTTIRGHGGLYICPSTNLGDFRHGWTTSLCWARFDIPKRNRSLDDGMFTPFSWYFPLTPNESWVYPREYTNESKYLRMSRSYRLYLWYIHLF